MHVALAAFYVVVKVAPETEKHVNCFGQHLRVPHMQLFERCDSGARDARSSEVISYQNDESKASRLTQAEESDDRFGRFEVKSTQLARRARAEVH